MLIWFPRLRWSRDHLSEARVRESVSKLNTYPNLAGRECSKSLISSTFPFNDAALSAAAAATARCVDAAHAHTHAARQMHAKAHANAHNAAARRTPYAPRADTRAHAAFPNTQHAPTISPDVNIWKHNAYFFICTLLEFHVMVSDDETEDVIVTRCKFTCFSTLNWKSKSLGSTVSVMSLSEVCK